MNIKPKTRDNINKLILKISSMHNKIANNPKKPLLREAASFCTLLQILNYFFNNIIIDGRVTNWTLIGLF